MKRVFIILTALGIHILVLEFVLRLVLFGFNGAVFHPRKALFTRYYPELIPIYNQNAHQEDNVKKVLILGGSVVSTNWSQLDKRLDTMLRPHLPAGTQIRVMNAAAPANTSLDNLIKYKALSGYHFDLVIFYEAINETRFNNVPIEFFKKDYTHVEWYRNIQLIVRHPEMNFTVIPYTLHFIYERLKKYFIGPAQLNLEGVPPHYLMHGSRIKTAVPYWQNVQELITTAKSRNQRLLLMSYASFFPEGVNLRGEAVDNDAFFGSCKEHSNISIWGKADNVQKGIQVHNKQLMDLAMMYKTDFLDMASLMPRQKKYFCDVCHLSQEYGAQRFAAIVKDHILAKGLLAIH
jgi:hypothetical protein